MSNELGNELGSAGVESLRRKKPAANRKCIFASSVQKEVQAERRAIKDFIRADQFATTLWRDWLTDAVMDQLGLVILWLFWVILGKLVKD